MCCQAQAVPGTLRDTGALDHSQTQEDKSVRHGDPAAAEQWLDLHFHEGYQADFILPGLTVVPFMESQRSDSGLLPSSHWIRTGN